MKLWKHSRLDAILFVLTLTQFTLYWVWAVNLESWSWSVNLAFGCLTLLLAIHNYTISSHEFSHLPWFTLDCLNRSFSLYNSVNLGFPFILFKYQHLDHHRHNNSLDDPISTWRHGRNGNQEHWLSYALLGLFRDEFRSALREIKEKQQLANLRSEAFAVVAVLICWGWMNWRFLVFAWAPTFFVAQAVARMSNYFGHFNATDVNNRIADSVNYYGRLWNLLMCNEGYHQEHHIRPQVHWSRRKEVQIEFEERMELAGAYTQQLPPLLTLGWAHNPARRPPDSVEGDAVDADDGHLTDSVHTKLERDPDLHTNAA